jgi:phosphoglycolate phosphatase
MIPEAYPQKLPKAILFDWDNTLVDTWQVAFHSINIAREAVGLDKITIEDFWSRPHHSMRDASRELFGKHYLEGEKLFYEHVAKLHLVDLYTLRGAEALLQDLKALGIYMGIVSNKQGNILRKEINHLGWGPHFKKIIGAQDTKEDKPSPIPVLAALHESKIDPSHDVWFVGDSIVDVHCARASGCIPVVVGNGPASQEADIVNAKDCLGVAKLIKSL